MKGDMDKRKSCHIGVNIIFVALFVLTLVLSYALFNTANNTRLLLRIIARGLFGILFIYDSIYLIFTKKWSFLSTNIRKQRILSGFLLGAVGVIMLLTAFLGYGVNGDPRLFWWR